MSLATDGQDGSGLHFENVWRTFSNSVLVSCKNHWKLIMVCSPCKNSLDISLLMFQQHFVCEWRHLISISAKFWRNARKTAPLSHALEEGWFKTCNGHFVEFKERTLHGIRHDGGFSLVSRPEGTLPPFDLDFWFWFWFSVFCFLFYGFWFSFMFDVFFFFFFFLI